MNYTNRILLFVLILLTFEINSQNKKPDHSSELMKSYAESVNKLAESYINIVFLTFGDTLTNTKNNDKFVIQDKENQIQGLVQEINKKLPVDSIESDEHLVNSLEQVIKLLSTNLERNTNRMSNLMKDTFLMSSRFIIKGVTNKSMVIEPNKYDGILSKFWLDLFLIVIVLLSLLLTSFLIFVRYESKKHFKNVTALILTTSIEQEK